MPTAMFFILQSTFVFSHVLPRGTQPSHTNDGPVSYGIKGPSSTMVQNGALLRVDYFNTTNQESD